MLSFLQWLRNHNLGLHEEEQRLKGVGLYGLDLYSLNSSTETVINYLKSFNIEAAHAAMDRYSCISRYRPSSLRTDPDTSVIWGLATLSSTR